MRKALPPAIRHIAAVATLMPCLLGLPGCFSVPLEVQREFEAPEPGQPNHFPLRTKSPIVKAR